MKGFHYNINLHWDETLNRYEVEVPEIGPGVKGYGATMEEAITSAHRAVASAVAALVDDTYDPDLEQEQEKTVA